MLTQLSIILDVPPPRLLLLREEEELRTDATVGELGLGIADIIGGSNNEINKILKAFEHLLFKITFKCFLCDNMCYIDYKYLKYNKYIKQKL